MVISCRRRVGDAANARLGPTPQLPHPPARHLQRPHHGNPTVPQHVQRGAAAACVLGVNHESLAPGLRGGGHPRAHRPPPRRAPPRTGSRSRRRAPRPAPTDGGVGDDEIHGAGEHPGIGVGRARDIHGVRTAAAGPSRARSAADVSSPSSASGTPISCSASTTRVFWPPPSERIATPPARPLPLPAAATPSALATCASSSVRATSTTPACLSPGGGDRRVRPPLLCATGRRAPRLPCAGT